MSAKTRTTALSLMVALAPLMVIPNAWAEEPPSTEWERTFGGESYERGYSVQQASDGGYVLAGFNGSYSYPH